MLGQCLAVVYATGSFSVSSSREARVPRAFLVC